MNAVLGDNGIGKTTLAKLAIYRLSPDAGRISPTPNRLHTGYCPQNTDETPENLEDFACDWSPQAMEIRRELGIGDDWPWRLGTLSGGEAKRLQIACALATDPDVLVLDEPTNHVDRRSTRERIIAALRSYDGIGILVSHDVALIDAVASSCALFERDHVRGHNITVVRVRGNYSAASMDAQRERAAAAGMARNARRESTRIDAVKEQRRRAATSEIAGASKAHRLVNPKDHDARSRIKKAITPADSAPRAPASTHRWPPPGNEAQPSSPPRSAMTETSGWMPNQATDGSLCGWSPRSSRTRRNRRMESARQRYRRQRA